MVDVKAYAAGASLFFPIVIKNKDKSWKQPSSTRSTEKHSQYCLQAPMTECEAKYLYSAHEAGLLGQHSIFVLAPRSYHIEAQLSKT